MLTAVYFRTAMAAAPTASRWGFIDAYVIKNNGQPHYCPEPPSYLLKLGGSEFKP